MPIYSLTSSANSNPKGLNDYIKRRTFPSPYEILPGVYSQTSLAQELNYKLYMALNTGLPASKAVGALLSYPGVPDEWSRLLNVMGVAHNPEGVPPFSTKGYHAALSRTSSHLGASLESKLDGEGKRRAKWLAKAMVQRARLLPLHIKRMVVTGVPEMSTGIDIKHGIIEKWHKNYEEYARLILSGKLYELADKFDVYFAYFTGRRYQPDKVDISSGVAKGKDRVVLDWQGNWVTADKTLPDMVEGGLYRDFFLSCRSRKISASPLGATYPLRAVAKEIEGHFDSAYEYTFYHTGVEALTRKTQGREGIYMLDVDNHDVNMPPELRDLLCDACEEVFGAFYAELLRMTFRMPQLIRNDYRGGEGVKLQGNPFDRSSFTADYVNPSGHPLTSILAKFAGAFYAYDGLVRSGAVPDTEQAMFELLRGERDVAFLNAGDNLTMLGHKAGPEKLGENSPYCAYSGTSTFQGSVAMATPNGSISWVPNIASYAINFFVPGRPIGHPQRGHWANGWIERASVYAAAPSFPTAKEIVNNVTREVLGTSIDDYAELRRSYTKVVGKSAVDSEFLLDPDIIYYKRHAEDISQEVIDQVYFVVEPRFYQPMHEYLISQESRFAA
jgi:hypothetical protein